jgi:hypothetical protein
MATTITRYVNTASAAGGDGTTNNTSGATRAYGSLAEAIADEVAARPNLVTNDELLHILCCGSAADGQVQIFNQTESGFTTDATRYIHIEGNPGDPNGAHYSTSWNSSTYRVVASVQFGYAFLNRSRYLRMTQIQIENSHATEGYSSYRHEPQTSSSGDDSFLRGVICRGAQWTTFGNGFQQRDGKVTYENCLAYDNQKGFEIGYGPDGPPLAIYRNCVAVGNVQFGFWHETGQTHTRVNCYAGGSGTDDYGAEAQTDTNTTCASEDGTVGTTIAYSTSAGAYFANVTSGSEDVAIGVLSSLRNIGTDLSGNFTNDIQGQTRSAPWDIGVDEFVTGGVDWAAPMYQIGQGKPGVVPSGFGPPSHSN